MFSALLEFLNRFIKIALLEFHEKVAVHATFDIEMWQFSGYFLLIFAIPTNVVNGCVIWFRYHLQMNC